MSTVNPYQSPEPVNDQPGYSPFSNGVGLPYASRWLRLGGAILDALVVGVPSFMVAYYKGLFEFRPDMRMIVAQQLLRAFVSVVIFMTINAKLVYSRGQTVGKMICGTMVVTKDGRKVSGNRYVFRRLLPFWILWQIPFLGFLVNLADALAIFRSERNCLHDDIAGTRVVDLRAYQPR